MVARNDGDNYGKLVVYRFPRQSLVFGPRQVINRINQNTEISQQVSLWDQRGSQVIFGNLLVIPIEEALLYVQPLYLRAEGGRIPELKRVIVAFENQVVMHETLDGGLGLLFGGGIPSRQLAAATPATVAAPDVTSATASLVDFATRARQHYDRALNAQRAGNWARYGEELRLLGEILRQMAAAGGDTNF